MWGAIGVYSYMLLDGHQSSNREAIQSAVVNIPLSFDVLSNTAAGVYAYMSTTYVPVVRLYYDLVLRLSYLDPCKVAQLLHL